MAMKSNGNINIDSINLDALNGTANQNALTIMTAIEVSKRSKVPVLFFGNPGAGKTATMEAWAEANGYHVETLIGSHYSQDEILGFPVNNGKDYLEILEPEWYHNIMEEHKKGKPSVLFLDELSMTPGNVQGSLLQLCFERKIRGNKKLPDDCIVVSAANYKKNLPGWTEIIAPELNRFCIINLLPGAPKGDLLSASLSVVKEFTQGLYTPKVNVPEFNDYEFDEATTKDFMTQVQNSFTSMISKYCKPGKSDSSLGKLDLRNIRYDGVFDREDSVPEVYNFLTGRTISYYARVVKALCEMGINTSSGIYKKFVDGLIGLGTNSWDDSSKDVYLAQMFKYQEMTYTMTEALLRRFSKKRERKVHKEAPKAENKLKLFDENSTAGQINLFLSDVNDDEQKWKGNEFVQLLRKVFSDFNVTDVKKSLNAALMVKDANGNLTPKENGILKFRADFEAIKLLSDALSKQKASSSEWSILTPFEATLNQVISKFDYYYTASAMDIESDQL